MTIKWVEGIQTKLPMCINGGIWGAARLKPKHRQLYLKYYLPWAIKTGNNAKFMQGKKIFFISFYSLKTMPAYTYYYFCLQVYTSKNDGNKI